MALKRDFLHTSFLFRAYLLNIRQNACVLTDQDNDLIICYATIDNYCLWTCILCIACNKQFLWQQMQQSQRELHFEPRDLIADEAASAKPSLASAFSPSAILCILDLLPLCIEAISLSLSKDIH